MDSKVLIDKGGVNTTINIRKSYEDFPISFMDFLNAKAVEHKIPNTVCDSGQSKDLMDDSNLATDNQMQSLIRPSKETSELENVTHSDEEFLPVYTNLFERIKRQSSDDDFFRPKCSPGRQEARLTNASSDNDTSSPGKSTITGNCENNLQYQLKMRDVSVSPRKMMSSSSTGATDAAQPADQKDVRITVPDIQPENLTFEDSNNKDEESVTKHVVIDNDAANTKIESRKGTEGFPTSFIEGVEHTKPKISYDGGQSKDLKVNSSWARSEVEDLIDGLARDEIKEQSLISRFSSVEVETHSLSSPSKETSELENVTHSDDEEFLPMYTSLFERIKRQSSGDDFFRPKYSPDRQKTKISNTSFSDKDTLLPGKTTFTGNCGNNFEEKINMIEVSVSPTKFKSSNNEDAAHSTIQTISKSVADKQVENMAVVDSFDKDKASIGKQLLMRPVEQRASLMATQGLHSDEGKDEDQQASETLPDLNLTYLERFCYKALVFQETGQVPVDCDSEATECYSSGDDLCLKPKNPTPCLCRFYSKTKPKKDQAKSSYKRPCRIGKGFASNKRNTGHSSCASCKILPGGKAANKWLQLEIGKSLNTKSAPTYSANVIEKVVSPTVGIGKGLKRKRIGRPISEKLNPDEESTRKYLNDLSVKTKLLAKLELSEKRLKHLADYDSNLSLVSDNMVPFVDGNRLSGLLSLSDDESSEEQKENVRFPPQTPSIDACIDLTSDSPPKSPYRSNQTECVKLKKKTNNGMHLSVPGRQKPPLGRSRASMGVFYVSESSDEDDLKSAIVKSRETSSKLLSGYREESAKSSKPMRYQDSQTSVNIAISNEAPVNPNELSKCLDATTTKSMESNTKKLDLNSSFGNWRDFVDSASTSSSLPSDSATESDHSKSFRKEQHGNISKLQSVNSMNERSCNPVASGSKEPPHVPKTSSSSFEFPQMKPEDVDNYASMSSWDVNTEPHMTYSDLLASYAAYDSDDDDRISIVMGSSGSPYHEDLPSPTKLADTVQGHSEVVKDGVTTGPRPSTSPTRRVLRIRNTERITQTMMSMKRKVKKEPIGPTVPQMSVNNALVPDQVKLSVTSPAGRPRGRPKKKSLLQPDAVYRPILKKAKDSVATESVSSGNNISSTPESMKLKRKLSAMQLQLEKVRAVAATADYLKKEALAAKEQQLIALRMADKANEKLKQERLTRVQSLRAEALRRAKEKARAEKDAREKEAREKSLQAEAFRRAQEKARAEKDAREKEAREKEKKANEAREKSWECPVCFEPKSASTQLSVTPCGHVFCRPCILQVGRTHGVCPLCNQKFTEAQINPLFFNFSL